MKKIMILLGFAVLSLTSFAANWCGECGRSAGKLLKTYRKTVTCNGRREILTIHRVRCTRDGSIFEVVTANTGCERDH